MLKTSYFQHPITNITPEKEPVEYQVIYKFVKNGKLKPLTDKVLQCANPEERAEAKKHLPFITPACICSTRSQQGVIELTGVACADIDGKDNTGLTPMMMRQYLLNDHVLHPFFTFISPSGNGLKAFFRYHIPNYSLADFMHALMQYMQEKLKIIADKSGIDEPRACFLCYDNTVTYNPNEPYSDLDVDTWLEKYNKNDTPKLPAAANKKSSDKAEPVDKDTLAHVKKVDSLIDGIDITGGDYHKFLELAFALASIGEDGRDVFLHCCSFYKGEKRYDPDQFFSDCLKRKRGTVTIASFFKMAADAGIDISSPPSERESINDELAEKEDFNKLPVFPDKVFKGLPPILDKFVNFYKTPAEKSMMLIAAITSISAVLPGIHVMYRHRRIEPNLYLYVFGKSGAGKGLLGDVKALLFKVEDVLEDKAKKAMGEYKAELKRAASSKRGEADTPDPPKIERLYLSGNNTSSNIIRDLSDNGGRGFIFDSEGDAFVYNTKTKDCYNLSDDLRKAAHHEEIDMDRVGDNKNLREHIHIKNPCLSVIISSTPNQMRNVFPNTENGFSARFNFFCMHQLPDWRDPYDEQDGESVYELFDSESKDIYCIYNKLKCLGDKGVKFSFTIEQRQRLEKIFSEMFFKNNVFYDGNFDGMMYRLGITHARICMVLTALRYRSSEDFDHPLTCSEEDFACSLEIMKILEQHSSYAFRMLSNGKELKPNLSTYTPKMKLYTLLARKFTTSDAVEIGKKLGICRTQVFKILNEFSDGVDGSGKLLKKTDRGEYMKLYG